MCHMRRRIQYFQWTQFEHICVAVGATELQRGRTVAQNSNMELLVLSQ